MQPPEPPALDQMQLHEPPEPAHVPLPWSWRTRGPEGGGDVRQGRSRLPRAGQGGSRNDSQVRATSRRSQILSFGTRFGAAWPSAKAGTGQGDSQTGVQASSTPVSPHTTPERGEPHPIQFAPEKQPAQPRCPPAGKSWMSTTDL